ncbi:MAG: family 10 glycosylhydrolase [Phycisphaerae bacterium]|nr:family 10 glycosylhydrolase [Phycisphaerae bacterium]
MRAQITLPLAVLSLVSIAWAAEPAPEFRGVWMHATQAKTPAQADEMIAKIERARFNTVFLLVWYWGGQAFFQNTACPMGDGVQAGYDPLGYMVEQCHQRGIQVHAWFVNGSYGSPEVRYVLDKHPDWAIQAGGAGPLWYDFAKPQVRRFQSDLMIECLRKYDVDGLHFDYVRYGPDQCYCDYCQNAFARWSGYEPLTGERLTTLPAAARITGNPLTKPTTTAVLAEFSDGTPAIAMNKLGDGVSLLLNWHAEKEMPPAVSESVKLALGVWTTDGAQVHITTTAATRSQYGTDSFEAARATLARLGYRPKSIAAEQIATLPVRSVLALPAVYLIPENTARDLETFVRKGGKLLIIDGPTKSMSLPAMQRITGFATTGRFINRLEIIRSTGRSPLVPKGKHRLDQAHWKRRTARWVEFRTQGVTELVRDVYRRAKAIKPEVQVSAAVFSSLESADSVCQDWPRWLRDKTIDFVVPMAYTEDTAELGRQISGWKTVDPQLRRIIPGLALYQEAAGKTTPRNVNVIRSQRQLCRRQGTHGETFFSLQHLTDSMIWVCRSEFYPTEVPAYAPPARR